MGDLGLTIIGSNCILYLPITPTPPSKQRLQTATSLHSYFYIMYFWYNILWHAWKIIDVILVRHDDIYYAEGKTLYRGKPGPSEITDLTLLLYYSIESAQHQFWQQVKSVKHCRISAPVISVSLLSGAQYTGYYVYIVVRTRSRIFGAPEAAPDQ